MHIIRALSRTIHAAAFAITFAAGIGQLGCIKQMILDGQIESTRKASTAIDTLHDYEVANVVAFSGLSQFEGMHYLAPDNADALFMLTKGWAASAFGFIEDQMEQAEDGEGMDGPLYLYQRQRAIAAYDRAIYFGIKLAEQKHEGFKGATKNDETIRAYLQQFTDAEQDAPNLFWLGYAWMSKTNVMKDEPAAVADLFVGVAVMERAAELDDKYMFGTAHIVLGSYHARSAMAELDEAKKHFDMAIAQTDGKYLIGKVQLAAKYYCVKGDKENYEKLLREVVDAGDVLPMARLSNAVAKRRAKRYLGKERMKSCGF